ncbi:MAG: glycosyltransferase family 2 protein, partial [Pseudomonadota bacterium]
TYAALGPERLASVIVVDDASTDATPDEVGERFATYDGLRLIRHSLRAGQSTALRTGILAASTPVIAQMDGDGQNDPADLPKLLERLAPPGEDGAALVGGIRTSRQADRSKQLASRLANGIRGAILRDNCPDTGCGIKVYHREVFLRLPFFTSLHRYLPAMFQTYGQQVAFVPVNDRQREAGISKYSNAVRALVGLYDLVGVSWLRQRSRVPVIRSDSGAARPAATDVIAERPKAAE